jgi:hypothetical protein
MAWPSAGRAYELLHGAKIQFDNAWTQHEASHDRLKRLAEDAFDEGDQPVRPPPTFGDLPDINFDLLPLDGSGVQDMSTRMMAHMLGLETPGLWPSASYFPGYELEPGYFSGQEHLQIPS